MAGVRDEPAHPLLGPVRRRLGFLARVEGRLDLAQHAVQRPPEAADLGARVALRHPAVEVAVGDGLRGLLDLVQRSQIGPHRRDAHHGRTEQALMERVAGLEDFRHRAGRVRRPRNFEHRLMAMGIEGVAGLRGDADDPIAGEAQS